MKKTIAKVLASAFLALFLLTIIGIPGDQVAASTVGRVSSSNLAIHAGQSSSSNKIKTLKKGKKVRILSTGSKWVKVSVGGVTGYVKGSKVKTSHGTASNPYSDSISGKLTKNLTIRSNKSDKSSSLSYARKGSTIKVLTTNSKWVKVKVGNTIGYVRGKFIKTKNGNASEDHSKGASLVTYAKRFLGNPYVYGGSSLTNGTDCSGFVMALYRHFGYNLPHSSSALRHVGRAVKGLKNAKLGDIICYSGHVAIYMGNNRIIHASTPSTGICIKNNASYKKILAIRRIF